MIQPLVFKLSRSLSLSHAEIAIRLNICQRAVEFHVYLALDGAEERAESPLRRKGWATAVLPVFSLAFLSSNCYHPLAWRYAIHVSFALEENL
ncbi:MAG: hypothetical protein LBN29_04090 [Mediterranea sp.]|jgi:hypothetical protein|nr:hypothetical protein [Mediterranea sp.]